MWRLLVLAAVLTITAARPETYREKEDFQYSRSSSDDGSKSGYYGAQRGNMGGNYERAHNMDSLAQHQMSGLVRQVEGELGEGAKQRSGSVFTSANSQGMYGSGRYDLSHLQGRNFQEGVSYDTAHSQSSLNSGSVGQLHSSANHAGYDSSNAYNSRYRGYDSARNSNQMLYANNQHHSADDLQSANHQQNEYASHASGYNSQSGYHRENGYNQANYDSSSRYGSNVHNRLVGAAIPVRVVVRPGTIVTVPVAAQTYDANQRSSAFDHNAINTEAEALSGHDERVVYKPTTKPKHYESSYSYKKEWEKHDTQPIGVPLAIPTVSPYPKNSELYEDTQAHEYEQQQRASQNVDSRHSSYNVKSASSSQSRHQAAYDAQHHSAASNADSSAYIAGQHNNGEALSQVLNNHVEDLSTKPKSYQSSYSYHKSWERQGDPYVIIPTNNDNAASQKLVSSNRGAYGDSHQYGSHQHYGTQHSYLKNGDVDCDCDENGHIRVARSVDFENQQQEDLTQQTQSKWDNMEDLSQHSQNLEDLGQQTQQSWSNSEDLGQKTQNLEFTQQSQNNWDKEEDLRQETQNLELTQQSQNKWEKIEDLGQQTQTQWSPQTTSHQTEQQGLQIEDLQNQNQWTQQETEHKHNWNTLELEPQSQTDTQQQIEIKEISVSTFPSIQKEEPNKPVNKISGGNNRDIHLSNVDKSKNEIHSVGNQAFQGVSNNNNNWYKDQIADDLGQIIQDNWKVNSNKINTIKPEQHIYNSHQSQSNIFYGYNSNDKQSLNQEPYNPWMYNEFYNTQRNNYDQKWQTYYAAEHNGTSKNNTYLESSDNLAVNHIKPLPSIWDKLDSIEKQSSHSQGVNDFNVNYPAPVEFNFGHNNSGDTKGIYESPHTGKPTIENIETTPSKITFTTKPTGKPKDLNNVNEIFKVRPQDIGRGDIGPEDVLNIITTSESSQLITRPQSTSNQAKESIKPLILSINDDKSSHKPTENIFTGKKNSSDNLEQSKQNKNEPKNVFEKNITTTSSTTTARAHMQNAEATQHSKQTFDDQFGSLDQEHESVYSENLDQSFVDLGQRNENADNEYNEQQLRNLDKKPTNFDQAWNNQEHISYIDNNFERQPINEEHNFEQQSTNLEELPNFGQQLPNFGQHSINLEQQSTNFEQLSTDFQFSPNSEQQNLPIYVQHASNFEQSLPNFEQQAPNYGQHSLNFEHNSKNYEQSTNFEQQSTNFEHQSTNLEVSPNFEKQHPQQQSPKFEQHLPIYSQQSSNFEQSLPNFEQHSSNFQQHLPNIQQHSSNFDSQLHNNEQSSPNFGQHSTNFKQDLPNFGQHSSSFANIPQHSTNSEQHLPSVVEHSFIAEQHPTNFEQQSDNMEIQALNYEHQSDNFEQQLGMFEQQSINLEPQDKDVQQQSLPSHKNKDFQFEEREEKQIFIPVHNAQGHWLRKDGEFENYNGNLNQKEFALNEGPKNLNQQMNTEWEPMDNLQHSQNFGMFSPIHDMPEKIDQERNTDLVVPKEIAVTESSTEPVTEKGFWKSVTNKFSNAKEKVKSWFRN